MAWYAVRTKPGAMRLLNPRTTAEQAFDGGEPGADMQRRLMEQGKFAIEAELTYHKISHYLPVGRTQIRHRRTKKLIEIRQPLVPGYVLVENITDWSLFDRLRWAAGPIRIDQAPAIIPEHDMAIIRRIERDIAEEWQNRRTVLRQRFKPGQKVVIVGDHWLRGQQASVLEATGKKTIRLLIDTLSFAHIEIPVDHVTLSGKNEET